MKLERGQLMRLMQRCEFPSLFSFLLFLVAGGALLGLVPVARGQNPPPSVTHIRGEAPADGASRQALDTAQAAMDRKDYAGAVKVCTDYLKKTPNDAAVHFELGYAYTAMKRAPDAEREYRRASELDPKMEPAFLNLGLTLLEGHPADAVAPLQRAAELAPNEGRPKLLLAIAYEHAGNDSAAAEQFRGALAADAKNFDAQLELARLLLKMKQYAEASSEFRRAIELQPDSSVAHLGMARSLAAQHLNSEADAELAAYLKLQPDDVDIRVEHAILLSDMDKNEEAVAELDRAAAVRPEDVTSLKLRAVLAFRQKNYDAALVALQKAAAIAPNDADVHARIGHMFLEKKDYAGAVRELATAYRIDPQDDTNKDLLAAQYLGGNYHAALELIDYLSKKETLSKGAWFVRANCYDKMNQKQEALDAYKKFLELNGDQNNDQYFAAAERVRILDREIKEHKK